MNIRILSESDVRAVIDMTAAIDIQAGDPGRHDVTLRFSGTGAVDLGGSIVRTARDLDICLGDAHTQEP